MKTIAVCTSASFYKAAVSVEEELSKLGFLVILPAVAYKMKETGDYEVEHYKTWFANPDDYHKKGQYIRGHFKEIEKCDAVLVINNEKHGVENYIGGNVLMEMAIAFYLNKQIYILNDFPEESSFIEEIKAFQPIALHGDLSVLNG